MTKIGVGTLVNRFPLKSSLTRLVKLVKARSWMLLMLHRVNSTCWRLRKFLAWNSASRSTRSFWFLICKTCRQRSTPSTFSKFLKWLYNLPQNNRCLKDLNQKFLGTLFRQPMMKIWKNMFPLTSILRVVLDCETLNSTWVENQIKNYLFVTKTIL